MTDALKNISAPTLVMVGEKDFLGVGGSVILHRHILGSRLEIVKDRRHGIHLEDSEGFNRLVLDFLAQTRQTENVRDQGDVTASE